MKSSQFEFEWLDWKERAYFSCPRVALNVAFPTNLTKDPWKTWSVAFTHACHGDFRYVPQLLEIADKELDGVLDQVCTYLFGDAGPSLCFPALIESMRLNENYEFTFNIADALAARGRLGDVEVLLDAYESNAEIEDAVEITFAIFDLLDPGDLSISSYPSTYGTFAEYRKVITATWKNLADRLGSEDVYVWRGDIVSVERIAQMILKEAREDPFYFPSDFRRKFEAFTGIDCSPFYKKGGFFQPLAATALVEGFLESPEFDKYQVGVRYFFGHPIPEIG